VVPLGCGAWGSGRVFGVEGVQGGFAAEAIGLWLAAFDVANKLTVSLGRVATVELVGLGVELDGIGDVGGGVGFG
jgi:hypothetical protein